VPVVLWLLAEPLSLEGEANGAEMQLPGPFGVRGGVGLPGTGECWKLDIPPEQHQHDRHDEHDGHDACDRHDEHYG